MSAISKDGMDSWLDAAYTNPIKPLYMLIKVDVDREIVYNQEQAEKYAENHCIISGVIRHWNYDNNTKLAETQQETAQVQEKATYDTGCSQTY